MTDGVKKEMRDQCNVERVYVLHVYYNKLLSHNSKKSLLFNIQSRSRLNMLSCQRFIQAAIKNYFLKNLKTWSCKGKTWPLPAF